MKDRDEKYRSTCESILDEVQRRYFDATPADQAILFPQLEMAKSKWLDAQLRLLRKGTLATQADLTELGRIKEAVDTAADNQKLVLGVARLIGALAEFA